MNSLTKYEIKSDIRDILAEIDYEEYMFNKIFKTNVTFKKSYKKFNLIYDIYGAKAYKKYVPSLYQKQDIEYLISSQNYLVLYDRHGKKTYKNLKYTIKLNNIKKRHHRIRGFLYKSVHFLSRKKLKLSKPTLLALPEKIS